MRHLMAQHLPQRGEGKGDSERVCDPGGAHCGQRRTLFELFGLCHQRIHRSGICRAPKILCDESAQVFLLHRPRVIAEQFADVKPAIIGPRQLKVDHLQLTSILLNQVGRLHVPMAQCQGVSKPDKQRVGLKGACYSTCWFAALGHSAGGGGGEA